MKYMLMMFGDSATMMETKPKEWIAEMIEFMTNIDVELRTSGELVSEEGLADATVAKTVRVKDGKATPTPGPAFADPKESLIGYWVVKVDDEARAIEIASNVAEFIDAPVDVRPVMEGPPEV